LLSAHICSDDSEISTACSFRDIYLKEFHGLEDSRVVWLPVMDVLIFMITARSYWTGFGFQVYVLLSTLFAHSRGIEAYLGSEVVFG